jgi:L-fuculose-phosphate aldolase
MTRWIHKVDEKGWVANHDGNASLRLSGNRFLATPTAFSKAEIQEHDLLVVNQRGQVLQGRHRIFSEFALHRICFATRPDAQVVLHAHPPATTGMAIAGVEVVPTMIAEAVVSLGDRIPLAPYALPGTEASNEALAEQILVYDVVMLANHGVIAVGDDLEQAFLRLELCEHLAKIQLAAEQAGGARRIPEADVERLLNKRAKAGLGPEARGLERPRPTGDPVQLVGPCSGPIPVTPTR